MYTIFRARVSCPTERMHGSVFGEGLIRTRVRSRVQRLCRPARPRPHLALVTLPPLPRRGVRVRKEIIRVHNPFVALVALDLGQCF